MGPRKAVAAVRQAAVTSKKTLQQVREVADPRTVAAGLAGLTAGEIVGGAIGGAVGIVLAGPGGAVVGGEIGAFTAGMIGLKLGSEAMYDHLQAKKDNPNSEHDHGPPVPVSDFMRKKTGERVGEIAGLTSGATVGLVVAGPVGGLIGAVIGEAVGGQLGEDAVRSNSAPSCSSQSSPQASTARWLDKFGRNTLGESMIILAGGTIGSIFGPSGRAVGQRIGIIVGKRVEWYELGTSRSEPQSEPRTHLLHEGSAGDDSHLSEESELVREMVLSDREAEIVALHAAGFSDKQIAGQLAIGPDTVKVHMDRICAKLGVETSEEVAAKAVLFLPLSDPTDESAVASAAKLMP